MIVADGAIGALDDGERMMLRAMVRNEMMGGATFLSDEGPAASLAAVDRLVRRGLAHYQGRNSYKGPRMFRLSDEGRQRVLDAVSAGLAVLH
jgi:hypothetical protein